VSGSVVNSDIMMSLYGVNPEAQSENGEEKGERSDLGHLTDATIAQSSKSEAMIMREADLMKLLQLCFIQHLLLRQRGIWKGHASGIFFSLGSCLKNDFAGVIFCCAFAMTRFSPKRPECEPARRVSVKRPSPDPKRG
jgi:hypothetical protein